MKLINRLLNVPRDDEILNVQKDKEKGRWGWEDETRLGVGDLGRRGVLVEMGWRRNSSLPSQ